MKRTAIAALLSGAPSTLHALVTGRDVLAATRAAATLLPGGKPSVVKGALVHVAMSAGWSAVLTAVNRRHRLGVAGGAVAGLAIAGLDLAIIGRLYPAVRELPAGPQWVDHVVFGALIGGLGQS